MLKAVCLWIVLIYVGLFLSHTLAAQAAYEIDRVVIFILGVFATVVGSSVVAYQTKD